MKNNWSLFILSIGLLLIATSVMLPNPHINLLMGGLLVAIWIFKFKKGA
mgnify:CR=1 FL=1